MRLIFIKLLLGITALISTTTALAQESIVVPFLEVEHSDNAFGRTTSNSVFQNGALVSTPQSLRAVSDTKVTMGAIWLNALDIDLGSVPLAVTPFVRRTNYQDNQEDVTSVGASFKFTLLEAEDDKLDFTLTPIRIDSSWTNNYVDSLNASLRYKRNLSDRRQLKIGLSLNEMDSNVNNGELSARGIKASYRQYLDVFKVITRGNIKLRSASYTGGDGTDLGIGLTVEKQMGIGDIFTSVDATWVEDDTARSGQPFAREVTKSSIEIGYAYPLDSRGLTRLVVYAKHENEDSNLGLYESSTNSIGLKYRTNF